MAAMVLPPRLRGIQQSSNMLRNRSMPLKQENIILFTIYYLFNGAAHCQHAAKQSPNYHRPPSPLRASRNHPCLPQLPISSIDNGGWRPHNGWGCHHNLLWQYLCKEQGTASMRRRAAQQTPSYHHPPLDPTKVDCYV